MELSLINRKDINMPTAARLNDKGTQHDGYYETVIIAGSSAVFIDGLPPPERVMRWTAVGAAVVR